MKVLFIQPPIEDFYDTNVRTYPLGLLYLAGKVRGICDASIHDFRSNYKPKEISQNPFPELIKFYKKDIFTPFSLFSRFAHFGAAYAEIRDTVRNEKPDIVCISSLFTTYSEEAINCAKAVKEADKEIITVIGGSHPTLFPEHLLKSPYIDFAIRGEGETPLFQLINSLNNSGKNFKNIKGLCFKTNRGFEISDINIENTIDLIPDRSLINPEKYRIGKKNGTFFLTSRGCPYACSFCGKPPVPYRRRTLINIEKEIENCISLGITAVDFEDDMLNLDIKYFHQILSICKGKNLTLSAMNGIYPHNIDIQTLEMMLNAGFRRLNFSLVDFSSSLSSKLSRAIPENLVKILNWLEGSQFLTEVHFIIGLPEQKQEDVLNTITFLMGKRLLLGPSIFYPSPGSKSFLEIIGKRWEDQIKYFRSSIMYPVNPLFPQKITFTLMKIVRFVNYIKRVLDKEEGLIRLSDLLNYQNFKSSIEAEIVKKLITEKRFIHYDLKSKSFQDEPFDKNLLKLFFETAKGGRIAGFKTKSGLTVDV